MKVQVTKPGLKYGYGMGRSAGASNTQALAGGFANPGTGVWGTSKQGGPQPFGTTSAMRLQSGATIADAGVGVFANLQNYSSTQRTAREIRSAALFDYRQNVDEIRRGTGQIRSSVGAAGVRTDIGAGTAYERLFYGRGMERATNIRDSELRRARQMEKEAKRGVTASVFRLAGSVVGGVVGGPVGASVGGAIGGVVGGAVA